MHKLLGNFFETPATELAPLMLGKLLCRNIHGSILKFRITETECYYGEEDSACHASKGKTARTSIMYEIGGFAYIYLCYGIHYLLNFVSGAENHPEAVLIRGIETINGPGKLTKYLEIDKTLNKENCTKSNKLWLESDNFVPKYDCAKRIGIGYAKKEDQEKLWRFFIKV